MFYAVQPVKTYRDLNEGQIYQIKRVYADGHIMLQDGPVKGRIYLTKDFLIYRNNELIKEKELYNLFKMEAIINEYKKH